MEGKWKSPSENPQGRTRTSSVSSFTSGTEDEVGARGKKVKQKKKKGIAGKLQEFKVRPKKKQDRTKEGEITGSLSDMETQHKPHKRHLGVIARIKRFGSRDELVNISPEEISTSKQRQRHKSSDNDSDAGRHSDLENKPSLFEKLRALSEDSSSDDEDFAKESLSVANRYRKRHGLRRFRANKELNDLAYEWARKLSREQFVNERNAHKYYGRNIYSKQLDNPKDKLNPEEVFDEWYREINLFTFGQNPEDPDITKNATQLLWKNSKEIGIGKSRSTNKNIIFVAAYFNPRGNIDDQYKDQVLPLGGLDSRKNRGRSSESSSSEDEAKDKNEEMAQGKSNKKNFLSQVFGKFRRNSDGDSDQKKKEKKEHHGFIGHRSGKYLVNTGKEGKEGEEKEKEKEEEREMKKSNFYVVSTKEVKETKKNLRKQNQSIDDSVVFDSKVLETNKNGTKPIGLAERESSSDEDAFPSSKSAKIEDNDQSLAKVPTLLTNLPTNKKDDNQPNGTVLTHLRTEVQNLSNERAIQNQIKRSSSSSDSDDEHHHEHEKSGYTETKTSDMLSQIKDQLKRNHDNKSSFSEDDKKVLTEIKNDKESINIETKVSSDMSKKTGFFSQMKIKMLKSLDKSSSDEDEPSQIVSAHHEDTQLNETSKTLLNSEGHSKSLNEEAIQNKNKRSSISSDSDDNQRDHQNHSGYTKSETSDMLSRIKNQIKTDHHRGSSSSEEEKVLTDIKDGKEFAAIELKAPSDVPKKPGIFSKMKSKIMQSVDKSSSDEDESLQVKTRQDKKQPDGIVMQLKSDEHDTSFHGKVVPSQNKRSSISSNSDDDQSKTSAMLSRIKNVQCSKDNRQSSSSEDDKETSSEIQKDKEFTNIETKISSDRSEKTGFFSAVKVKILQSVDISLSDEDEFLVEPKEDKDSNSEKDKNDKDIKPIFVNRRHSSSDEEKRDRNGNRSFSGSLEEIKMKNLEEVKEKRLSHTSSDDDYKEPHDNDTSIKDEKAGKTGLFSNLKEQIRKRRDSSSDDEDKDKTMTTTLASPDYNEFESISNKNENQDSVTFKVQEDHYIRDDHSSSDEEKTDKHIQSTQKKFSLLEKLKNQFRKRNDSSSEEENKDDGPNEIQDLSLLSKTEEPKTPVRDLIKEVTSEEKLIRTKNKSESSSDDEEKIKEVSLSDKSHYVLSENTPSVPIIPYTQRTRKSSISSISDEENEERFKEKHDSKQPFSEKKESDIPARDLINGVTFEEKLNRTRNKSESSSDDEEKRKENTLPNKTHYALSGNVPSVPIVPYTQRIRKSSISSVSDEENEERFKEKHDSNQSFSERKESDHSARDLSKEVNFEEESNITRKKSGSSSNDEGKRIEANLFDKPHYVLSDNMPSVPIMPYTRRTRQSSISSLSDEDNDKLNLKEHNTTVDQPKNDASEILTEKQHSSETMEFNTKPNTNDSDSSSGNKAHSVFDNFKKSVVVKSKEGSSNSDEEYETKTSRVITEEVNTNPDIKSTISYGRIQQKQEISKRSATTNKESSSSSEDEDKNNRHEKKSLNNQIHFAHDLSLENQKAEQNASSDEKAMCHVSNLEIKPFNESSSKSSVLDKLKSNFQRTDDSNSSDEEKEKCNIEDVTNSGNKNVVSEYKIEINRPNKRGEELNIKRDSVSSTDEEDLCAKPNENTKDIAASKVTKNLGIIDFIKGQFNKKEKDYDKHSSSDEEYINNDKILADKSVHTLESKSHFYVQRMDSFSSDDDRNVAKVSQEQKEKFTEPDIPIEVSQKPTLYGQMKSRLAMKSKEISSSDDEKEDKNVVCDNKFVADIEAQTKKDKKSSKPGILRKLKDKLIKSEEEIDSSSDNDNQEEFQREKTKEVHINLDKTSDAANFVQKEDDTHYMESVNKFDTTEKCLLRKDIHSDGSSSSSDENYMHMKPIKKDERDSYVEKLKHVFENLGTTKHGSCEKYESEFIHEECKNAEYIRQMLGSINRYRSLHKADKLILNKQLCNFAKKRASSFACGITGNLNSQFGENIFIYPSSGRSVKDAADLAVEAWYKPAVFHTFGIEPYDYDLKTGPFTQLVWRSSREIGIGIHESSRENRIFIVAIFSPAGNVRGHFTSEVQAQSDYSNSSSPEKRKYIDRLI